MEQRTGGGTGGRNNGGAEPLDGGEMAARELEALRERFGDVSERITGFIREKPGTSILIALGAGFVVGRLLRS